VRRETTLARGEHKTEDGAWVESLRATGAERERAAARLHAALGRLLGPAGSELTCEECFEMLDRYVELELLTTDADRELPGMHTHLHGCPACSEEHANLKALIESSPEWGL